MSLHVAIVIVGFRNPDDVVGCLEALSASRHQDFEVVICENGGDAAFAALSARTPAALPSGQAVQLINAGANLGYGGGVNAGIRRTPDAGAWWVLNPDTRPDPVALSALVERLSHGDCEAVGGAIQLPNGLVQAYGGRWQRWLARAVSLGYGDDIAASVDPQFVESQQNFLNGASMLVSRRFIEATGLMREDYFLYCEEVEWCLRGLSRGMRFGFAPEGVVVHEGGTSTGNTQDFRGRSRLSVYLGERNRLLLSRDCFPSLFPVTILTALGVLLVRYGKRRAWRELGYAVQGWGAGLANSRGMPSWGKS
ncbi:MAG TPA: glycosyltransferase family 2 protein [Phenylobacterium sp.]|jgi:hypothetical protein